MPYELWWTFGILAWVAVFLAARLIRLQIRAKERVAIREMLHKERVLAIERGVPLPEIPVDEMRADPASVYTMARLAIVLIGVGGGVATGFFLAPNAELHSVWSLGLVPLTLGVACAAGAWTKRI
jgi:hypothetical protein